MGGNLFKDKCTSITLEDANIVVDEVITKIKEKYPDRVVLPVGSAGFKEVSSDIDIAIQSNSIEDLKELVHNVFGEDTYMMSALYIVSIPYKYIINSEEKWVSIDFIQMVDTDYTYFRYKSPDYLKGESKYKVGTKIMLVGDLLRLSPIRLYGLDPSEEAWMDYSPIGLYRYVVPRMNPSDCLLKQFMTLDVDTIMRMIFKDPKREWFDSVETLWEALHTQEVVSIDMVKEIEISFFVNCYRKTWEEQVNPKDFLLVHWRLEDVYKEMEKQMSIRAANAYLDKVQKWE